MCHLYWAKGSQIGGKILGVYYDGVFAGDEHLIQYTE